MRGHQALIDMRLRGWQPEAVFVSDGMDGIKAWRDWPQWAQFPQVEVQPADKPRRLDLRFAYGLTVHMDCANDARMESMAEAFMAAGAARFVGCVHEPHGAELRCVSMAIHEPEKEPITWRA